MTTTLEPTATAVPTPAATTPGRAPGAPRPWLGFAAVLSALIMNLLDSTVVNVAAPSIQRDLGSSSAQLQWTAAAYTLALAVGLLTGGRLGDRYGRRTILLIGLAGFTVASVACATAWSPESLIGFRVVQGLSAALLTPQVFGLIRDLFPPERMGKALAALGPAIGISTVAGPIVAGQLINWNPAGTDWRSIFLINLPLGLFALIVGARVLPRSTGNRRVRIDPIGTLLIATVSFLLVFPLVDGRTLGWPLWVFGVLAAAVPVLVVLVRHQRRRIWHGRTPVLEVSLLRKRSYVAGIVFTLVFFGAIVGFSLTLGLFLQLGLGLTAMHASLWMAALAVGAFFGSGVGAWAATAVGRPILHVGLVLMSTGVVIELISLHAVAAGSVVGGATVIPGLAVYGFGMGMIFVPLFSIIIGEIDDHEVGSASGMLESFQQLGASLGVAVLGTVFFGIFALERGGPGAAVAAGRHLDAIETTMLVALALQVVAFALGWFLPRRAKAAQH